LKAIYIFTLAKNYWIHQEIVVPMHRATFGVISIHQIPVSTQRVVEFLL
jgi:hypothetical protein